MLQPLDNHRAHPAPPSRLRPGTPEDRLRLRGADLRRRRLIRADLRGADLAEADLRDADLREARLEGADLRGARLDGTRLLLARYDRETRWPEGFHPEAAGAVCVSGGR